MHQSSSKYNRFASGINKTHTKVAIVEGYTIGDHALYLLEQGESKPELLYGSPIEDRELGQEGLLNSIAACHFVQNDRQLLFYTTLLENTGGLGVLDLENPDQIIPILNKGIVHEGVGEFEGLEKLKGHPNQFLTHFNIDGCDWVYTWMFVDNASEFNLDIVLVGQGELSNGVVEHIEHDEARNTLALSFSTATSPTQIYTIEGLNHNTIVRHTSERLLGIPDDVLSSGEDASFTTYDELCISARLYLPADTLGSSAHLLYTWGTTESGASGLRLVLHAPYPVSNLKWLWCNCTQRSGINRLWIELYQKSGS